MRTLKLQVLVNTVQALLVQKPLTLWTFRLLKWLVNSCHSFKPQSVFLMAGTGPTAERPLLGGHKHNAQLAGWIKRLLPPPARKE
jgi:hypothetical protein